MTRIDPWCRAVVAFAFFLGHAQTPQAGRQPAHPGQQPAQPVQQPAKMPSIGVIRNADDFDGPGCSLWMRTVPLYTDGREVFRSDAADRAVMHIDGQDRVMKVVSPVERPVSPKIGDRTSYDYRSDGITVRVQYVVTGVCKPEDESCEVTNYDATVTVTSRSGTRVVQAHGICGS